MSDRPRLPWQRKFGNFDEKMAKPRLIQEIEPHKLHQLGVFEVRQFNGVIEGAVPSLGVRRWGMGSLSRNTTSPGGPGLSAPANAPATNAFW